ncbi:MAG TPA: type I-E CRISPR-associated protein Cse2/CasB [Candidatus Paceibacterota bacterium]|nr:type I-E CRISPR-associated protein Cse2/CasB [Verrucomicrobiota bacterium]HRY49787.1 type I-E CRISPR-associated protein Cse2/CasB [Candidatus Paceibacterota bacterium]
MSETKRTPKDRAADFVGALRRACNDRGKLATLRRGLTENPRLHVDAWPVIASLGGDIGQPAYVAIAALFAIHPDESTARSFGETCRRLAQGDSKDIAKSFEHRFRRLLACDSVEDVIGQLRSWIRLAASKGIGVNYESLFADLWNWPWYSDDIRIKWAKAFWQSGEAAVPEAIPTSNPAFV